MEIEKKELVITYKLLEEIFAREDWLEIFNKHYPNSKGVKVSELLKKLAELKQREFIYRILSVLPFNKTVLEVDNVDSFLFYDGSVHVKGDVNIQNEDIYILGNLNVDGKITISLDGYMYADQVDANEIYLSGIVTLHAKTRANTINMRDFAFLAGNTNANIINNRDFCELQGNVSANLIDLKYSRIYGNVNANEITNYYGLIKGNVNTIKIKNIGSGKVDGKITYKHSDEHK